jgi:Ca2+-binding EF-hand superfamily protein
MNRESPVLISVPRSKTIMAVVLAIAVSGCAQSAKTGGAAAPDNPVDDARLQGYFKTMDQDGDGLVSRPEFESGRGAVFLAIDRNNSMSLTSDEMHLTPEAFAKLAGDDGVVMPDEFVDTDVASFDKIDASRDNQISYDELRAFVLRFGS